MDEQLQSALSTMISNLPERPPQRGVRSLRPRTGTAPSLSLERRAPPCRRSHDVDPSKHPCAVARAVSSQLAAHASSASDARFYFFLGYQAENGEASFNGRRGRDSVKAADLCRLCSDEPVAALQSNSVGPRRRPRQRGECVRGLMHQNPELGEKHRGSSPHILGLPPVRG